MAQNYPPPNPPMCRPVSWVSQYEDELGERRQLVDVIGRSDLRRWLCLVASHILPRNERPQVRTCTITVT